MSFSNTIAFAITAISNTTVAAHIKPNSCASSVAIAPSFEAAALSEEYVLGSLMRFNEGIAVCDALDSRYFKEPANQWVWQAIRTLADEGKPYRLRHVLAFMRRHQTLERIRGADYLSWLEEAGVSIATLHVHVAVLCARQEHELCVPAQSTGAIGFSVELRTAESAATFGFFLERYILGLRRGLVPPVAKKRALLAVARLGLDSLLLAKAVM